jgi:hypothetical protein
LINDDGTYCGVEPRFHTWKCCILPEASMAVAAAIMKLRGFCGVTLEMIVFWDDRRQ